MRFKLFMLAAVAALATAMPARATIVLEWHFANSQVSTAYASGPNPDPTSEPDYPVIGLVGLPIAGNTINLNQGQTVILQAVLHQIDSAGPNVIPYVPGGGGGLIGYGVRFDNSAPALATHIQPSANNTNTRGVNIDGFPGAGTGIVTQGSNSTVGSTSAFTTVRDVTGSDWYNSDNFYPLFNFRFQATNSGAGGTGTLTFVDPSGGADIGTVAVPNMDAGIFGSAPVLTFNVAGIPEPSSMVLCGLGLAGLGMRLRRKKVAKEEAAA
jgi:hypothetical protein